MNILYIHQYFKTPFEPGGTRSYWIAKELVVNGNNVTILTTSNSIKKKIEKKNIDGINVVYFKVPYNQKMNFTYRLFSFFNFMIQSTLYSLFLKKIDLVIATSTPLTVGFPALVLKKIKNIKYIFEVRDLWPEVPIQMGVIKNKIIVMITRFFEKTIYKNANFVVTLSPGMQNGVIKYIPIEKTVMIPNMAKIDKFWPRESNINLMQELRLSENTFKVIHFGALGLANGIDKVLDTIELMNNNSTVEFIFIGGGSTEQQLQARCGNKGLKNVKFLGSFPMDLTSEIVNLCDVSLVSFKDIPILYTNSPNKLFDSLSAGKPIIVNSAGWTKDFVIQYNCGLYVNPNKPEELVDGIKYLQKNHEIRLQMGLNSRKLAEEKYDKAILSKQFIEVINKINL
jgi:glycosyltransferase involved in cell wall biosynthesis